MEMISLEEARVLVCANVSAMDAETVDLLDAAGRVSASDLQSDMDVSPFAHSAMDGFAVFSDDLAAATPDSPAILDVIAEVPAGSVFEGTMGHGQCVRIMTGAPTPKEADAVVKYEIVDTVDGDGRTGSRVAFSAPAKPGDNIRAAGEEAKAGETIVRAGEVIGTAGIGFLAGCGVLHVPVHRKPRVAVIAIGSELVAPPAIPGPGQIRNSNSYALAACARSAGCIADVMPIVLDDEDALADAVLSATADYDFIVTSGGASNGDFDFIKPRQSPNVRNRQRNTRLRPARKPCRSLCGIRDDHPPRTAQDAGIQRAYATCGSRPLDRRPQEKGPAPHVHALNPYQGCRRNA